MCGIAGIWHRDRSPVDRMALRRMTHALVHRGPDEEGYFERNGIGLGHRRLSIIDLSTGQQPLSNEDGSVWISFNGEIFNYIELRRQLERRGHVFRTHSDTETIVHLYEEKGLRFVDDLNGQFAIALWDARDRRLVLARDRVGIRPLFHATLADGTFLFASEIKAILAHGALPAQIDPVAIGQVATFWVTVPPRTPFKNIQELPPAHLMVLEERGTTTQRYWRHEFPAEHEYEERTLAAWSDDVRELLHDAVRLQLRADVPVATYLSGGLDSSILSTIVRREHDNNLTTFSVGFADARFDESAYQRQMIDHIGSDHKSILVNDADVGQAFADVVWFAERPTMRTAPAPLLRLSALVRGEGIKVVLTGEGADEIFGGYNIFREDKVRRYWAREPDSDRRAGLLSRLYGYVERDPRAETFWRAFFRKNLGDTDDPYYSHRKRWDNTAHIKRAFSAELRAQMQSDEESLEELTAYLDQDRQRWHPLCRAQYLETVLFMSCYLLNTQGDRMMMANSVEGRVPFLDHRLIELAARIPPRWKIRGLQEKYILKQAFAKDLPPSIVSRPKQPYRAPISACFSARQSHLASRLMSPAELDRAGLANSAVVGRLLKAAEDGNGRLAERDEMAVCTVASVQLLNHLFVDNFRLKPKQTDHDH